MRSSVNCSQSVTQRDRPPWLGNNLVVMSADQNRSGSSCVQSKEEACNCHQEELECDSSLFNSRSELDAERMLQAHVVFSSELPEKSVVVQANILQDFCHSLSEQSLETFTLEPSDAAWKTKPRSVNYSLPTTTCWRESLENSTDTLCNAVSQTSGEVDDIVVKTEREDDSNVFPSLRPYCGDGEDSDESSVFGKHQEKLFNVCGRTSVTPWKGEHVIVQDLESLNSSDEDDSGVLPEPVGRNSTHCSATADKSNIVVPESLEVCAPTIVLSSVEFIDPSNRQNTQVDRDEQRVSHLTSSYKLSSETIMCSSSRYSYSEFSRESLSCPDFISNCLTFCDLPAEIVLFIFSYFTPQELCGTLALVCKKWKQFAYEPVLWHHLYLNFHQHIETSTLCSLFQRAPLLKRLSLHGRRDLSVYEVNSLVTNCPQLEHLDLGFCDSVHSYFLEVIAKHCRGLQSINIEGCPLINHECVKHLCHLGKLRHFDLTHCEKLGDESVICIAENVEVIETLSLDGVSWVTDNAVKVLLRRHHKITCLQLDGEGLTDDAFQDLPSCENLQAFAISFAELLTDATLQKIKCLSKLNRLKLKKGKRFTSEGLTSLFQPGGLRYINTIDLTECSDIRDEAVVKLAQCCQSSLKRLSLCWCWEITDVGLSAIVDNCSNLIYLNLLGIVKLKGECLQAIPEKMPKLVYLDLQQCSEIIDELVLNIVKVKKDLTILDYYGEEFCESTIMMELS